MRRLQTLSSENKKTINIKSARLASRARYIEMTSLIKTENAFEFIQEGARMKEYRCKHCNKLLFKGKYFGIIEILCNRCKKINQKEEHQECQSK